ncbi:MAG: NYN domain-containing protein [Candidatus Firestonebacteria bacterium]
MKIIIDGYNVMRSTAFADDFDFKILKNQRERFLSLLSDYAGRVKHQVIAVFDGAGSGGIFSDSENFGKVEVVFSSGGETADDVIKKMAAEASNPRDIIVVSSDKEIMYYVKQCGARVVPAGELYSKIRLKSAPFQAGLKESEYMEKYVKGYKEEGKKDFPSKNKKRKTTFW